MYDYDVLFLGSGHAAWHGALKLVKAGKKVAFVDGDLIGGTCTNYGCDAKILLDAPFAFVNGLKRYKGIGVESTPDIDWSALMKYKKQVISPLPAALEQGIFGRAGMPVIHAMGKLLDTHTVQAGDQKVTAEYIVIATGEHPVKRDVPGKEFIHDSRDFLDMETFPKRIAFIGAGIIAMEFASMAIELGSDVTVIHHNDRALKMYPAQYVDIVVNKMREEGVKFDFNESVAKIEKSGDEYIVTYESGKTIAVDYVLEATGREANVDGLGLDEVGIEYSSKGIKVNSNLQTTVPNIYASGDVIDKKIPKLTPTATFESNYIADHILDTSTAPIEYPVVPNLVFTLPRIAQVGVSVDAAKKDPEHYDVVTVPYGKTLLFEAKNEVYAEFTFVFDKEHNLVGAAFVSDDAGMFVDIITLIINKKMTQSELNQMIFAFPTESYGLISMVTGLLK
ncbi:dihydrolipoyl dehydrogenase family protein [Oribacterium sp. WCC10]|uniref:dihydrolipoyl dehydrogenase family protein n=1 Tax=Oribacterium sp. WCC10 TaxID=1855343 RepID=UPI0008EC339C|nr:NAD(P)/FAD-dependent oxidoreductase [Oribacterium sp. WCC10]SFG84013.1 glutathione reductase (NADPH) [Oribacterium sp. WCC10]